MRLRPALAVPLLFLAGTSAMAQSSLQIGGLIDIGLYRDTNKTWQLGPIQRSNLEFSGTEDLGGGLAATFNLNLRFETDTGQLEQVGKPFFHGESTVGLKGPLGSIRLGRALDAMESQDWKFDAWGNFDRIASPAWDIWHYNYPTDPRGNADGTPEYGRLNNGMFYDSPSFNGFAVHLSTAANEDVRGQPTGASGANNPLVQPWGVSLNYDGDAWAAMLAHERNSNGDTDSFVGLRATLGDLSVYGAWDRSEALASSSVAKVLTLSVQYVLGNVALRGGWGRMDLDGVQAQRTIGAGVSYAFSKRTSVYVDVASKRFPGDDNRSMYGVGMAHAF
ncbi:MAG: porin [Proteobacteria bacterium]|nr:porin [Pseudomonadota bacterium]